MEPNNNIDCSQYPDCGCVSSCREANSVALRDMVKRLNEPDLFEVVKEESKAPFIEACCKSASYKSPSMGWEKQPVERVYLGPVTMAEKQALEESNWRPEVKLDESEIKRDSLGMKELMDIYKEMQKEEAEEKHQRDQINAEKQKKDSTKALLLMYSNIHAYRELHPGATNDSIKKHMDEIVSTFRKVVPDTVAVICLPVYEGNDRVEVIRLP